MIHLKSPAELDAMARGGAIIGGLFRSLKPLIVPGVDTGALDRFCDDFILSHEGATPAFKGLYGFPGSVCISVNHEVVHGIPSPRKTLSDGDIVSVDVGVRREGWCSDSAWTFRVGEVEVATDELLRITEHALREAISVTVVGNHIGDIGAAVMDAVAGTPFGIIRDLVGHGVGRDVHEDPQVPNIGRKGQGPLLRSGMVLAIEPMLSAGSAGIRTLDDGWTVVTSDGSRAAHFEHTVAVTPEGPRVLTAPQDRASVAA